MGRQPQTKEPRAEGGAGFCDGKLRASLRGILFTGVGFFVPVVWPFLRW